MTHSVEEEAQTLLKEWIDGKYGDQGLRLRAEKTASILERLLAELSTLKAAQDWQPIETAPKDGTRIIVRLNEEWEVAAGEYHDGVWLDDFGMDMNPMNWIPMPAPER